MGGAGRAAGITTALIATAGILSVHLAAASAPATQVVTSSWSGTTCVLKAGELTGPTTHIPAPPRQNDRRTGSLTVAIPRAVFIRAIDTNLLVTTNTGVPPQPDDVYYLIVRGHAAVADDSVRRQVESGCAANRTE